MHHAPRPRTREACTKLALLLCAAEGLACTQLAYDLAVRKAAVDELHCPKGEIAAEALDHADPTKCTKAVYVARGCDDEAKYECTPVPHSQQCRLECALVPDPVVEPPVPGPGPGKLITDVVASTEHDHPESCWINETGASDDSQVDMMLFVIGLNHPVGPGDVDAAGVRSVAEVIKAAWPHPESVVVVSSSFRLDCPPDSGACLEADLQDVYDEHPFELEVQPNDPKVPKDGTRGVLTGGRWRSEGSERWTAPSNPGEGITRVKLFDTETSLVTNVYAVHTATGEPARDEIEWIASTDRARFPKGFTTPIIAGDFNMTESAQYPAPNASSFFCDHFLWINHDVKCTNVPNFPDGWFSTQNGNVMQALVGRVSASEPAYTACEPASFAPGHEYPCATGYFEPVRISYSVDGSGRLAVRAADRREAWQEGILLGDIGHNVLAFGLRLTDRRASLSPKCQSDNGSGPKHKHYKCTEKTKCCEPDPDHENRCQVPCIHKDRECR